MLIETWSLDVVNVTLFGANTADMNGAILAKLTWIEYDDFHCLSKLEKHIFCTFGCQFVLVVVGQAILYWPG